MSTKEVLEKIKPMVIADTKKSGILASLTAAQLILESGWLRSGLTVKANNAFGIKGSYKGAYYLCKTKEYVGGKYVEVVAKFKRYPDLAASIADHSALLSKSRYRKVKAAKDYMTACREVKAAGYATAPDYDLKLIRLIEQYRLYEWDDREVECNVDEVVYFSGGYHYRSSDAVKASGCKRKAGAARVTKVVKGAKHPYHLIGESGGSNVYGWVDAKDIGER